MKTRISERSITYKISRFVIGYGDYARELYSVTDVQRNRKVRHEPWPYASRQEVAQGIARHHIQENGGNMTIQSSEKTALTFFPGITAAPNKTEKPLDEEELRELEKEIFLAIDGMKSRPKEQEF